MLQQCNSEANISHLSGVVLSYRNRKSAQWLKQMLITYRGQQETYPRPKYGLNPQSVLKHIRTVCILTGTVISIMKTHRSNLLINQYLYPTCRFAYYEILFFILMKNFIILTRNWSQVPYFPCKMMYGDWNIWLRSMAEVEKCWTSIETVFVHPIQ
jgi:hypothetical protein